MQPIQAHGADHGRPLVEFLVHRLRISGKQAKRLLDSRSVFVNHRRVWMARHPLSSGDIVEVHAPVRAPQRETRAAEPALLADRGDVVVVNKPAGRLSTGDASSVESWLRERRAGEAWTAVHRLDRDTTGCMILALEGEPLERMIALFEARAVRKIYQGIATGRLPHAIRRVNHAVDGLESITELRIREASKHATWVEASPLTGRTHQIRVHLRTVGHPLAGDRVYATREIEDDTLRALPRQMLHAWRVSWKEPGTGETVRVEAPLPADFRHALQELGLMRPAARRAEPRVRRGDGT